MPRAEVGRVRTFLAELKRRKVYQVSAIYAVLAIGGLEVASVLLPSTTLPEWFDELFLGLAIVGLPLVLVLAWAFDITESGIERTADLESGQKSEPVETPAESDAGPRAIPETRETELDRLAVAVLPFENLSGSDAAEPFALGLHDDLLTELSRASALTVISRTSVRGYRGTTKSMREIGRELGAGTIIEGGVQQTGNRVRLNVQVIDVHTDGHIWAERYDRELTAENIFELQSELAARIMAELHAQLTAEERGREHARPTESLEAYRLFATGRQALVDRSEQGFRAAASLFEQAIALDGNYALAWSGLGDALVGLVDYGHVDSEDVLSRGAEACRRALELDPDLAEAHAAWGGYRTAIRDAPGSALAHGRAIELRPSYAGAYQWSCWAHLLMDHGPEALAFGEKATRLDPVDPEAAGNLAVAHLLLGQPERALGEAQRILRHHPAFEYALWVEGLALHALGRWAEGRASLSRLRDRWTRGWADVAAAVEGHTAGDDGAAQAAMQRVQELDVPFKAGLIHALLGDDDEALATMRSAFPLPWDETLYLYFHREAPLRSLREDPRFVALVADVRASWGAGAGDPKSTARDSRAT